MLNRRNAANPFTLPRLNAMRWRQAYWHTMRRITGPACQMPPRPAASLLALVGPGLAVLTWALIAATSVFPESLFPGPAAVANGLVVELRSGRLVNDVIASLFRVFGRLPARRRPRRAGRPAARPLGVRARRHFCRSSTSSAACRRSRGSRSRSSGSASATRRRSSSSSWRRSSRSCSRRPRRSPSIPSVYFRVARDLRHSRAAQLLREVTLPAIVPQVITALRVTAGLSWLVVVAAEMIAGRDGLGFAIVGRAQRAAHRSARSRR